MVLHYKETIIKFTFLSKQNIIITSFFKTETPLLFNVYQFSLIIQIKPKQLEKYGKAIYVPCDYKNGCHSDILTFDRQFYGHCIIFTLYRMADTHKVW
jgi:hypothetical protein